MRSVLHHRYSSRPGQVITSLILFMGLCCTIPAKADQWGDWTYTTDGSNVTITGYTGADKDLVIPDVISNMFVVAIGAGAFMNSYTLTGITFSTNITDIGSDSFWFCTGLTSIVISPNVTNIGKQAFLECGNLTNVNIGVSIPVFGPWAFVYCANLTSISADSLNPEYKSMDGVLFNKTLTKLIICPAGKTGIYIMPDSIAKIQSTAFASCIRLTSVPLPEGVIDIGDYAFGGCGGLTNIMFLDHVMNLGVGVFYDCSSIVDVRIGNSVRSIGHDMFYACTSMTNFIIPNGVTNIDDYAFASCNALKEVTIPNSLTRIGNTAFNNCRSMTSITIPSNVSNIGSYAFEACGSLMGVYFKGNAPSGDGTIFSSTYSVTSYYYPWNSGWTYTYAGRPTQINPAYTQWRNNYGFTTSLTNDFDDDGMLNWQEYLAGTSPTNDADRLAISSMGSGSNSLISWLAKSNVSYQVMRCSDLLGTWGNAASGAETNQQSQQTATTDQILQYMDPGYAGDTNAFYRVNVVP